MTASSPSPAISRAKPAIAAPALARRFVVAAHVVGQRAAAADALGDDDLDAEAREQPDRGGVYVRCQRLLRAAGEQGDARAPRPLRAMHARTDEAAFLPARWGRGRAWRAAGGRARCSAAARRETAARGPHRAGPRGTAPDAAARKRAAPAARGPARGGDRCARYACARDRRGACNARPRGTSSCRRGRRGSGRYASPPPLSRGGRVRACP